MLTGYVTTLNLLAFFFHLTLAVVCGVVGDVSKSFPLYLAFTTFNSTEAGNVDASISFVGEFPLTIIFVTYFTVTAFFHFGSVFIWNDTYFYNLEEKRNPFRWIEYSITAPLMTSILAFIVGSRNFILIIAACIISFTTIGFGPILERTRDPFFILYGLIPFLAEFALLIVSLYVSTTCFPTWVPITLFVEFVLWSMFPLAAVYQLYGDYEMGELLFIILSFLAKSVLAIILLSFDVLNQGILGAC